MDRVEIAIIKSMDVLVTKDNVRWDVVQKYKMFMLLSLL